jgi:hypothetical protein
MAEEMSPSPAGLLQLALVAGCRLRLVAAWAGLVVPLSWERRRQPPEVELLMFALAARWLATQVGLPWLPETYPALVPTVAV